MKERKNTNDVSCLIISPKRKYGNSTRQIDKAIQDLFNGYTVVVEDHHDTGKNRQSNILLYERILDRLELEHNLYILIDNKIIRIDRNKLELELI